MPKGKPNKRYTGEFKQMVIETMHQEKLSQRRYRKLLYLQEFESMETFATNWLILLITTTIIGLRQN